MFRFQSAYLEFHVETRVKILAACLRCLRDQRTLGGGKGAVFAAVKGVFEPVLQGAVLPEVSVGFIRRIELNITVIQAARKRVQAFIRQQEQGAGCAGVGAGIQHAPFDGSISPDAVIDVAIAALGIIAVDAVCDRANRRCGRSGALCLRLRRQETKHHAADQQEAEQSFFHGNSSLSSGVWNGQVYTPSIAYRREKRKEKKKTEGEMSRDGVPFSFPKRGGMMGPSF